MTLSIPDIDLIYYDLHSVFWSAVICFFKAGLANTFIVLIGLTNNKLLLVNQ